MKRILSVATILLLSASTLASCNPDTGSESGTTAVTDATGGSVTETATENADRNAHRDRHGPGRTPPRSLRPRLPPSRPIPRRPTRSRRPCASEPAMTARQPAMTADCAICMSPSRPATAEPLIRCRKRWTALPEWAALSVRLLTVTSGFACLSRFRMTAKVHPVLQLQQLRFRVQLRLYV